MTNKGIVTAVSGDELTVIFERHEACGDCHACMHGSTDCAKHTVKLRGRANVGGLAAFIGPSSGGWRSVNARRARILRGFCAFRGCGWRLGVVVRL